MGNIIRGAHTGAYYYHYEIDLKGKDSVEKQGYNIVRQGSCASVVSLNRLSVGCGTTPRRQCGDSAGF